MQRSVLVDQSDQCAGRSLSVLRPVEAFLDSGDLPPNSDLRVKVALVEQLEAIRYAILAAIAPDGS